MLSVTSAQIDAWVTAFFYPLARILALVATAPAFGNAGIPRRIRLLVGIAVTLGLTPALPTVPAIAPGSMEGMLVLFNQVLIGVALGFVMRLVFAAVDMAGELAGLQMGLSFAVFYDPQNTAQTAVVAEFLGLIAMLVFLSLDGHLMLLTVLARSFEMLPIGAAALRAEGFETVLRSAATVFAAGVMLSLPLIAALLITNIALGVLTRAAPQLNLFAVGFPVALVAGFSALALSLSYLAPVFQSLFEQGLDTLGRLLDVWVPAR
jgi:flagellar biosynthetic protein FliR